MKVRHQIAGFLAHKLAQGLKPASVSMCKLGLLALLGPTLDDPADTLTPARVNELGRQLRQRHSRHTDRPLKEGTLKSYLATCRAFFKWRSLRQALHGNARIEPLPSDPIAFRAANLDEPPRHAGELVRQLRQNAGLLRSELGEQTGLSQSILHNLERGMTAAPKIWQALLGHPAMQGIGALAKKEGILLEVGAKRGRPPTVEEAIGLYLDKQHDRGIRESSIRTAAAVLRSVFRPVLGQPLTSLYPTLAREIIDGLPGRLGMRKKQPLTERTRRAYREQAHAFLKWCVKQQRIPANPLALLGTNPPASAEQAGLVLYLNGDSEPKGRE